MAEGAIPKAPRLLRTGRETKVRSLPGPLPLMNSGPVDLLENERVIVQRTQLERRTALLGMSALKRTWSISCSIRARSVWRGCFYRWQILARREGGSVHSSLFNMVLHVTPGITKDSDGRMIGE